MAIRGINGTTIAFTVGGIVLLYSGLRGKKITQTIKEILSGKVTGTGDPALAIGSPPSPASAGSSSMPIPQTQPGISGGTPATNQAIGRIYAAAYGWYPGNEWDALVKLWTHESNWDNHAKNPSSGAYGIAQALPESKYPFAGTEAGGSSATVQIAWGLQYIQQRYGDPLQAWNHELQFNWY